MIQACIKAGTFRRSTPPSLNQREFPGSWCSQTLDHLLSLVSDKESLEATSALVKSRAAQNIFTARRRLPILAAFASRWARGGHEINGLLMRPLAKQGGFPVTAGAPQCHIFVPAFEEAEGGNQAACADVAADGAVRDMELLGCERHAPMPAGQFCLEFCRFLREPALRDGSQPRSRRWQLGCQLWPFALAAVFEGALRLIVGRA